MSGRETAGTEKQSGNSDIVAKVLAEHLKVARQFAEVGQAEGFGPTKNGDYCVMSKGNEKMDEWNRNLSNNGRVQT